MDRGDWRATIQGITKSWTLLSTHIRHKNQVEGSCVVSYLQTLEVMQQGTKAKSKSRGLRLCPVVEVSKHLRTCVENNHILKDQII